MAIHITTRSGRSVALDLNKITARVRSHSAGLDVDADAIASRAMRAVHDGVTTVQLDAETVRAAADMCGLDTDYSRLAARLLATSITEDLQARGINTFVDSIERNYQCGHINDRTIAFARENAEALNAAIVPERDHLFEYFGLRTLQDRYFLKEPKQGSITEGPQFFFMRVACGLADTLQDALDVYGVMSRLEYLTSSPTLFNSGARKPQMSSCFLHAGPSDDLNAIYDTYKSIALMSKFSGGIGVDWSRVRSNGSPIVSTNGRSNGIVPWLKTLDSSVASVNQGGKRKGACAVYLQTWHADIESFLELRDNTGDEARRTHNLNLANWIPDLFMKRVEADGVWSLFDPKDTPELVDLWGEDFEHAYEAHEKAGRAVKTVQARELYGRMMRTLAQTGNGWMTFKDRSNALCNQTGKPGNVVHSSNLCVAGDTTLRVDGFPVPIKELVGQTIPMWNGEEISTALVVKTGTNRPLKRVKVSVHAREGWLTRTLDCTAEHRWFVVRDGEEVEVRTHELAEGDLLSNQRGAVKYVASVEDLPGLHDTYCVKEPKRGRAVFNGILTGNCSEIIEVNSDSETAVCNLGSINLAQFVENGSIAWAKLAKTVRIAIRQLDRVIDRNYYTTEEGKRSNSKWRPIGLGLMGLQDVFFKLRLPFDSAEARALSTRISEEIYFHALTASSELARETSPHPAFAETRAASDELQFDLWGVVPSDADGSLDWDGLKEKIAGCGLRNSLLIAIAPTATIASIAGCYECIEPQVSNLFKRETMSGDFLQVNNYLVNDLKALGLWTQETRDALKLSEGSVSGLAGLGDELRKLYRTAWELPQRALIDLAAARGPYIDQSQSLNLFMESPTIPKLSSMYMHAWKQGLKTTYYLRSRPATKIAKATVSVPKADAAKVACSLENPESCEACQ